MSSSSTENTKISSTNILPSIPTHVKNLDNNGIVLKNNIDNKNDSNNYDNINNYRISDNDNNDNNNNNIERNLM
jgi:hypothetical protein